MKRFLTAKNLLILIVLFASILRLFKLTVNPPSLFGDELDLGYQAYSILNTGNDYRGNFLPIHFHSLAEYRTPLYLYAAVPTVALFGVTPLGVRLPAALFGILSVWLMYLLTKELLTYKQPPTDKHYRSILAALLMAISPWSLQYSRAGFEVTLLLTLLMAGLYFFMKSLTNSKWLWVAMACLMLTPWVYATAKLFTPLLVVFLLIVFEKDIILMKHRDLVKSIVVGLLIAVPIVYSTVLGGGTQRINDISVLSKPGLEQVVGEARDLDKRVGVGVLPSRLINNKYILWGGEFVTNYFKAFSTEFLFIKGDTNLRQGVGMGNLYLIEIIPLLLGLGLFFFDRLRDAKIKLLMAFWLLMGAFPSALTLDGGNHATRLILLLPPLLFFIAIGWLGIWTKISDKYKNVFTVLIALIYVVSLTFYFHQYYYVYPAISERWWHYGWEQGISEIKKIDKDYDRVIISMSGEPAWIFFAGHYQYDPVLWQKEFPIGRDVELPGFGKVSHTGKFYFGSPDSEVQIYGLGRVIDSKTLYLANAKEIGNNLILHPDGVPPGLKLLKSIPYLSGEPAMYLFAGTLE